MRRTSPIWKVSKEAFAEIIKNSTTIAEVLAHFKFENKGNNYKTVHKRVEEEGLDISHFTSKEVSVAKLKIMNMNNKRDIEEILVKDSPYVCNSSLKRRLRQENVIDYICSGCGNNGEWNGKELVLQLEHKNGDNRDHRRENLCYLCPNCHSQTDTFAGKNNVKKKPVFHCSTCGKGGISKRAKVCNNCATKSRRLVERPSLEVILSDISELGYSGTGRKYGVSDNAIRKWIKSAN